MNGTMKFAIEGPYSYSPSMKPTKIGYTRCSTNRQDLSAQRQALIELGVSEDRIYTDHGLTGANRVRPGLDQAIAALPASPRTRVLILIDAGFSPCLSRSIRPLLHQQAGSVGAAASPD